MGVVIRTRYSCSYYHITVADAQAITQDFGTRTWTFQSSQEECVKLVMKVGMKVGMSILHKKDKGNAFGKRKN